MCAVCHDEKTEELICKLECDHTLCDKCVIRWIVSGNVKNRLKCPVCRQNMFPKKDTLEASGAAGEDEDEDVML